eukprot:jgi/Ulvmu1/4163/UM019_0142.1
MFKFSFCLLRRAVHSTYPLARTTLCNNARDCYRLTVRPQCALFAHGRGAYAQGVATCTVNVGQNHSEEFMDALLECGALVASVDLGSEKVAGTSTVVARFAEDTSQNTMQAIIDMSASMVDIDASGMTCVWQDMDSATWKQQAKASAYVPIRVNDNLWVVPEHTGIPATWHTHSAQAPTIVRLHASLAFGSGEHPTTKLCLQWLAHVPVAGRSIVDYGCGSGVLGIVACILGAQQVVGYDIEDECIEASRANAMLNGVADRCSFNRCSSDGLSVQSTDLGPYDICMANMFQGDLLALRETFIPMVRRGGKIVISGILVDQAAMVIQGYEQYCSSISSWSLDGWAVVEAMRK